MNTTLATERRFESTIRESQHPLPVRRVGLVDRAALHLGVALIKWGRRPSVDASYERRANRLERALASTRRTAHLQTHREQSLFDYSLQLRMR